ncbi:MAG TPA: hypothetical protein VF516_20600 [Kofleriaceae bacterium]
MRIGGWQLAFVVVSALLGMGSFCQVTKSGPPPPKTILDTPQSPRTFDGDVRTVCGGKTFPVDHDVEWQPVVGGVDEAYAVTGLSGSVVESNCSGGDFVFTHPMGPDWETYIAVDRQYAGVLAPANQSPHQLGAGKEFEIAQQKADEFGFYDGIMGTEIDQGMSQPRYHACSPATVDAECPASPTTPRCANRDPKTADRTVIFGRWIVDCGHPDFHTEIHPPLLSVVGYATTDQRSDYTIEGRPFLTSQHFNGESWWQNAQESLAKGNAACMFVPPLLPCPFNVDWSSTMLPPFAGTTTMVFYIRPSSPPPTPTSTMKMRGRVYLRPGVTFEASARDDSYQVVVTMNGDEYPVPDVAKYDGTIPFQLSDLGDACKVTNDRGSSQCEFFGLQALLEALWIGVHPLTPDNYARYRRLNVQQIWADEAANQPTGDPNVADFQVLPAKQSLFPIQGTFSVEWVGEPTGRTIAISPQELNFALSNTPSLPITLKASGTLPVTIRSFSIDGPNSGDFTISADACTGHTLMPGNTCQITIRYAASGVGGRSVTLHVNDDAVGSPQAVPMSGLGWVTMR